MANDGGIEPASSTVEKRSLRSQDTGSRLKSKLAQYFANYEQVLGFEPEEHDCFSSDTKIHIENDLSKPLLPQCDASKADTGNNRATGQIPENPLLNLHDAQIVDLTNDTPQSDQDPLLDKIYFKAHRRHERQEKQLKNIERDRAQHEKLQLESLLSELKGHDWLRVMGVTGVSDAEKKTYEPKRDYFIKEVSILIEKFRMWKEEEKRRKVKKEQQHAAEHEDENDNNEASEANQSEEPEAVNVTTPAIKGRSPDIYDLPDIDDVDGWAAHQLQREAMSASGKKPKIKSTRARTPNVSSHKLNRPVVRQNHILLPFQPASYKPFTSFFDKPHLRAAALDRSNKRDHRRMAFGQPLPEMPERDFELPSDILTPDAIAAASRRNRVRRRELRKK